MHRLQCFRNVYFDIGCFALLCNCRQVIAEKASSHVGASTPPYGYYPLGSIAQYYISLLSGMINTKIQLWITKIIWSIRHKFQRSITCITFESLKLRPWSISQGGQMSDDDDISSFLSRPRPALSDICVQFITPGNAPGPNSGPVGTFQWMRTVWKPDAATIWVFGQKAAHGEWRRRSRGIYCENNALSPHSRFFHPSVRNTNTPNQTNINLKGETVCPDWNWLQNWENNMWYICFFGIHNVPKYKRTHIEMTILRKSTYIENLKPRKRIDCSCQCQHCVWNKKNCKL